MKSKNVVLLALTISLYTTITVMLTPISFGPLQFRAAEILKPLALLDPFFALGFAVAVGMANLASPFGAMDFIGMPVVVFEACFVSHLLRKKPYIALVVQAALTALGVSLLPLGLGAGLPVWATFPAVFVSELALIVGSYAIVWSKIKTSFWFEESPDLAPSGVKLLFKTLSRLIRAKRWVNSQGVKAAAHAMFWLNRVATRMKYAQDRIFALKALFVQYLYENDFCNDVVTAIRIHDCYGVRGYSCEDGSCPKCAGTGIYRTDRFWLFTFDVLGRRYVWMQPQRLVRFHVATTGVSMELDQNPRTADDTNFAAFDFELYYLVVWLFLKRAGVDVPSFPITLKSFLRTRRDRFRHWYHLRIVNPVNGLAYRLKITLKRKANGEPRAAYPEDDIPF